MALLNQQGQHIDEVVNEVPVMPRYVEKSEIAEIIQAHAVRGRIACGRLRKVAKELGLPSNQLGAIAKEYNIKIVACELGCF